MKSNYVLALLVVAGILGFKVSASAQERASVTMTHDFVVAGQTLPAGTYTIRRELPEADLGALLISGNGRSGVLFLTNFAPEPGDGTTFTFEKTGDQQVLREIRTPNGVYTLDLGHPAMKVASVQNAGASASGN